MDTPGVKLTWKGSATSTLPILMSGLRLSPSGNEALPIDGQERTYVYEQTQLVPSYLLAIAGGELVFASLGERTGVWAEPSLIKAAEWEFKQDAERYDCPLSSVSNHPDRITDSWRRRSRLRRNTVGEDTTYSFSQRRFRLEGWRTRTSRSSRLLSSPEIAQRLVPIATFDSSPSR